MRGLDARDELRKTLACVDGERGRDLRQTGGVPPLLETCAERRFYSLPRVREVQRRSFRQNAARGGLDLQHVCARDKHREVGLRETEETVPLDDDARGLYARQRRAEAGLDLPLSDDRPVNVRGPRVPVAPGVLAGRVRLRAPRADDRLFTQQVADAEGMRVFDAG